MNTAVSLQSVSKRFPTYPVPALRGINLDILAGSRTALFGPSGSGKTTILRLIAGLEDPSDGRILIDGRDVTSLLPEQRGIGMVFQRPLLFPHLSVLDNVAFSPRAAGARRAAARRDAEPYLDLVQLPGFGDRPVHALSGGQQQRVAIARALAARPTILLLDEPFSALDAALREEMHGLLADIRSELPPTIVLVTHDRDEAASVADRIAVIEDGMLLQYDTVERIFHRPSCSAVARLMGGRNAIPGQVHDGAHHSGLGAVPVEEGTPDGPGILVVRQEAVRVLEPGTPAPAGAPAFTAVVTEVGRIGPRPTVVLRCGGVDMHAEPAPGVVLPPGSTVTFLLPAAAVSVVPR